MSSSTSFASWPRALLSPWLTSAAYKPLARPCIRHPRSAPWGRRAALEREAAMKWLNNDRYLTVVNHLAGTGSPKACFIIGLTLVFAHQDMQCGLVFLERWPSPATRPQPTCSASSST